MGALITEEKVQLVTINDISSLKSDVNWLSQRISDLSNDIWLLYDYFRLKKGLAKKDKSEAEQLIASAEDKIAEMAEAIKERKEINPKGGVKKYGKVKFADTKNNKYPIDTEEHCRAAWSYINMPKNAAKYNAKDLAVIKRNIKQAGKKFKINFSE